MKRYLKKYLTIVLTMIMAFSLTACGGSKKADKSDKVGVEVTTGKEEAAQDPVEVDEGTFKIGGIADLSSEKGQAMMNGAQIAADEINQSGSLGKRKLELNFVDGKGDAEESEKAYNQLKDWGAQILIGGTTEEEAGTMIGLSTIDNMFLMIPSAASEDVSLKGNVFKIEMGGIDQGAALAQYIQQKGIAGTVGIIYNTDDQYSANVYGKFSDTAELIGLEVRSAMPYTKDDRDYSVQIQTAKDAGVEMVFLPVDGKEAMAIMKQANEMDFHPLFFGSEETSNILTAKNFDAGICEGMMLITSYMPNSEKYTDTAVAVFTELYKQKYGEEPDVYAAEGYDAVYALQFAIQGGRAVSSMDVSTMSETLINAMPVISLNGLTGSQMTWSASGEVTKNIKVVRIEGGTFTVVE